MSPAARVSVLIPCHNAERYLDATLASVCNQTRPADEIIVVDDASSDRSKEIAQRYAPLVTVAPNVGRGAGAARNRASAVATGDFFQYVDADDLLEPHAIASRLEMLNRTGADVAISDWQRLNESSGTWSSGKVESGALPDGRIPADENVFVRGFWAPPAAILYRRRVWEQIARWREDLPIIQDARFLYDAARGGARFVHVEGVGARYRQHEQGSLSTRNSTTFWRDVFNSTREIERLLESDGRFDDVHRAAVRGAYVNCALIGFQRDRQLFDDATAALTRIGIVHKSRMLKAAMLLTRVAGYGMARAVLAPLGRSE